MRLRPVILPLLIILVTSFAAQGAVMRWTYAVIKDEFSDRGYPQLEISDEIGNTITFICSSGDTSIRLAIFTDQTYDQWVDQAYEAKFRIDTGQVLEFRLSTKDADGKLVYWTTNRKDRSDVSEMLRRLSSAKERVVVGVDSHVYRFSAYNSIQAREFMKMCGVS